MDAAIIVVLAVLVFAVIIIRLAVRKTVPFDELIANWAKDSGAEIVSVERKYILRGPFGWSRLPGAVFYIRLKKGPKGRAVWMRIHRGLFGPDWHEVEWDDSAIA
jgi:hypothetical protein